MTIPRNRSTPLPAVEPPYVPLVGEPEKAEDIPETVVVNNEDQLDLEFEN